MQVTKVFVALMIWAASSLSLAKDDPNSCRAIHWPFSANLEGIKSTVLKSQKRTSLTAYLYSELTTAPAKRVPGLAFKLLSYLAASEPNQDRSYFFQTLMLTADLDSSTPTVYTIKEICDLEKKALAPK